MAHYRSYLKELQLFRIFELAKRRYGIEFLVFDNLQYLVRNLEHTPQEIAYISRQFKLLAMRMNMQVMVISQPRQMKKGELMTASHMKGSSAMEADADTVLICHRKDLSEVKIQSHEKLEDDQLQSPFFKIVVDRSRYARGGFTTLYYDGPRCSFREMTQEELKLDVD